MPNVRPCMDYRVNVSLLALGLGIAVLCSAADLDAGDGLTRETPVRVLSARSQDELFARLDVWIQERYPGSRVVSWRFEYIADDRASLVVRTLLTDGGFRRFYFETPGLPIQFVREPIR